MRGSVDGHDRHLKDTSNYFDMHLEIALIRTSRYGAIRFYEGQAHAAQLQKPSVGHL